MRPERMAGLVAAWVRFYTRDLPDPVARRRIGEIDADVHDHIAHERAQGSSDRRIALGVLSRMARGLAADASWRMRNRRSEYRSAVRVLVATAVILLVPLVAMQFTDEVVWTLFDFAVAGALLAGTGLTYRAAARRAGNISHRVAVGGALAAALFLVWTNLAVGIIGDPGEPANAMYIGVVAVGIVGTIVARLRPEGMARVMLAMALAMALAAVIALIAGEHQAAHSSVFEILAVNGFFTALFAGSARLFQHAARRHARQ